jgi:hypothetical protein
MTVVGMFRGRFMWVKCHMVSLWVDVKSRHLTHVNFMGCGILERNLEEVGGGGGG